MLLGLLAASVMAPLAGEGGKWPWQRRIARNLVPKHRLAYQLITSDMWPAEPSSPGPVDSERFSRVLSRACGPMPAPRLEKYTTVILREANRFEVDPFLLAALVVHRSGCLPRTPDIETRWGVTRIDIDMHAPHVRGGEYRYFLKENGQWQRHALDIGEHRFNKWSAQKIPKNIYFAAAIIHVFKKQCPDLDEAFKGTPHRHPISHWFYGDKVKGIEPEDSVLTVRRRLLDYYKGARPKAAGEFRGIPIHSPLHGAPRLVLDYFGNKRGDKRSPGHMGVDIAGLTGEPVMAVAKGRVAFAGIDLPTGTASRKTTPEEAAAIPRKSLGKAGIWVTLNHGSNFRTCYMHLDALAVESGDTVAAGDVIGTLGNTGTTTSGPHLHLEFRTDVGGREDPAEHLKEVLVNPFAERSGR
jgi:hypothetical protein